LGQGKHVDKEIRFFFILLQRHQNERIESKQQCNLKKKEKLFEQMGLFFFFFFFCSLNTCTGETTQHEERTRMSQSEDSESGNSNTSGSAMASGSSARSGKLAAQDQAGTAQHASRRVVNSAGRGVFSVAGHVEDAVVQRTVGEMIAGVELLALQNVR
jgi:hypothetical protein